MIQTGMAYAPLPTRLAFAFLGLGYALPALLTAHLASGGFAALLAMVAAGIAVVATRGALRMAVNLGNETLFIRNRWRSRSFARSEVSGIEETAPWWALIVPFATSLSTLGVQVENGRRFPILILLGRDLSSSQAHELKDWIRQDGQRLPGPEQ